METFARWQRLGIVAAVAAAPLGCLDPTEAILDITTDASCTDVSGTGITAGLIEELDTSGFATTASDCSGEGNIGSMVLVPREGNTKDGPFAFKVVTSLDAPVESCVPPDYALHCIVARRAMRFVPHHPFHVPVRMSVACAGVSCPETQTCVDGVCVSATVDPIVCDKPDGCNPKPPDVPPWQIGLGGPGLQLARALAATDDGLLAVAGNFEGELDFGGAKLVAKGAQDIFLATFTQAGAHRWSASFGGLGFDGGGAVAIGKHRDVYLLATFEDSIDFGGGVLQAKGTQGLALAKFTGLGKLVWAIRVGDGGGALPGKLAVDSEDNITIAAQLDTPTKIGETVLTPNAGGDVLLASFTSSGNPRWAKTFGGPGQDGAGGVGADADGNVYVTGRFEAHVSFGEADPLSAEGATDVFVASFDKGGALRWAKGFGSKGHDLGIDVAVRGERVVVTGGLGGTATIEGKSIGGAQDGFVAAFARDGKLAWAQAFGGKGNDRGDGIALATDGAVVVGGVVFGGTVFDSKPVPVKGVTNPFVAVLEPDGTPRWAKVFSSSLYAQGAGVAAGSGGDAFLAGWFTRDLDANGTAMSSKGDEDLFLMRVNPP